MTTISQIISDAYRETNLVAVGSDPTTAEQVEALRLLNRVVKGLFGYEFGEKLKVLPLGKASIETPTAVSPYMDDFINQYVPENTRLMCNLEEARIVNLHPAPTDGCRFGVIDVSENFDTYNLTLVANGRTVESATSVTLSDAGINREWFYRADLGEWKRLTDLELTDDSPFPEEFDDLLILTLALRLSPRQGPELTGASQVQLTRIEKKFRSRYLQKDLPANEIGMLPQYTDRIYGYSSTDYFNRGIPR